MKYIATVSDYKNTRRDEPVFEARGYDHAWEIASAKYKGTTDFLVGLRIA